MNPESVSPSPSASNLLEGSERTNPPQTEESVANSLDRLREEFSELNTILTEYGRDCMEQTEKYVRENPWKAVTCSIGVGLLLGMLLKRK